MPHDNLVGIVWVNFNNDSSVDGLSNNAANINSSNGCTTD